MPTYACHNNDLFVLTIDTPTKQDAENATGLSAVEAVDGKPWAGWIIEDGIFKSPRPFQSWIWDGSNWNAPEPKPNDPETAYCWNEQELQWMVVEQDKPYPSWIIDEKTGTWIAPKPKPDSSYSMKNPDGSISVVVKSRNYAWNEQIINWELVS